MLRKSILVWQVLGESLMGIMLPATHLKLIERAGKRRAQSAARSARPWTAEAFWPALVLLPAAAAVLAAVAQPSRRGARSKARRERNIGLAAAGVAAGLGLVRWQLARLFAPQPSYEIEARVGPLEIRHYPGLVQAVTTVEASSWREGLDEGFGRLASYIFGANRPRLAGAASPGSRSGALKRERERERETASYEPPNAAQGEKLAMTSPVMTHGVPSMPPGTSTTSHTAVTVAFVMPGGRPVEALPTPLDRRVRLRKLNVHRIAALRFNGAIDSERIRTKQRELLALVDQAGLKPRGQPLFAGYDPPTTLPALRRLEVWVELG